MIIRRIQPECGVARIDVVVLVAVAAILVALIVPAAAGGGRSARQSASNANLTALGFAHAVYAADWNGRQVTYIDDEMSSYGAGVQEAFDAYQIARGALHPPITLGWFLPGQRHDQPPRLFAYRTDGNNANRALTMPINFEGSVYAPRLGSFRMANARPLRSYLATRYYQPVFYAPADHVVLSIVEPFFDDEWEYVDLPPVAGQGDLPGWTSYAMSPAAMFDPGVMRSVQDGGWQDPWSYDDGFRSPGLHAARHPSLKTLMFEHHWLQNTPINPCNPVMEPSGPWPCEPWSFNQGLESVPATLFYDLSVAALANETVQAADERLIERTGEGLWHRGTPMAQFGYFIQFGFDNTDLSHNILTIDGILGRDTTAR